MLLDLDRSHHIATRIRATAQACWYNAFRAMSCPDLMDARYVEGWVVEAPWGLVVEHGWVEDGAAIIDPTPGASLTRTYFAGLRLPPAALLQRISTTGCRRPPFIRTYPRDGPEGTVYLRAYVEAWVYACLGQTLEPLAACGDLECDGLTRCLHILLTAAEIAHTVYVGTCTAGRQTIPLHWWIQLPIGWRLDYRARCWLGAQPTIPHGLVRPADYPALHYRGQPQALAADPALFALLAPTCDLATLVRTLQDIPYRDQVLLPAGQRADSGIG